ncbi:TetR/AcrR family transcriptional regulator [Colwellia psychrerythraea]|uniref:Transcriptional regulator, TetR family n=1 Tax=Colwellia psychrerythraea TaxID=28229 RepID=A0A099L1N5_COLPS|nr:TetR/AcrR family transcriptional regulator [Colwellia psychrerythraea]KGJ96879.1 transcriptional regulator, TetR family [Colwellia psychrerythraea]
MPAGRHRSFDKELALEKAMLVFWKNGYPGTSLTDLTTAMGINKPSLYAAFGNKERLFNQALLFYLTKHGSYHSEHLLVIKQCLKKRVENYLLSIAKMLTDPDLPKGCFICLSTSELAGSCLPQQTSSEVKGINQQTLSFLHDFFEKEKIAGHADKEVDVGAMANYLLTLQFGLAVAARNGSDLAALKEVITVSIGIFN